MSNIVRHLKNFARRLPAGDPYYATVTAAEQNRRANEAGAARVSRSVKQAALPSAASPLPVPKQQGIQQVWVTGVVR
jgi:hypothetical protein